MSELKERECRTCCHDAEEGSQACLECVDLSNMGLHAWRWKPRAAADSPGVVESENQDLKARDYYDGNACIDACRLATKGRDGLEAHLVASAIQYLWRSGRKGPALPDVRKAFEMCRRLIVELGGEP